MSRVFLTVLDSVGCGYLPDADLYGDVGANTLGHVIEAVDPNFPNLAKLGLGRIPGVGYTKHAAVTGAFGRCMEISPGKDTTTGHWELSGVQLNTPFPTFPDGFPADFITRYEAAIGHKTIGNKPASGTVILEELGQQHMETGYPIVYTSADSVFQIACHEEVYPVSALYRFCEIAREMLQGDLGVGRVIARPFIGTPGAFKRTGSRKDFSMPPTGVTLLDVVKAAGMESLGVGKIEDIFAHRGLTGSNHAAGNDACMEAWIDYMHRDFHGLCFVNLVDTDMIYGHRRDPQGYAHAIEKVDARLPEVFSLMKEGDLLVITADHGCDPTFRGTDHTREYVPLLCWHKGMKGLIDLGTRSTFSDVACTCAQWLGVEADFPGTSFAAQLKSFRTDS